MEKLKSYVNLKLQGCVIMKTKLTLNIDHEVIYKAKQFAKTEGRSLSDLVEDILSHLVSQKPTEEIDLSPRLKELAGSLKPFYGDDFNYKEELGRILTEKYVSDE